jgi:hypothetical protein
MKLKEEHIQQIAKAMARRAARDGLVQGKEPLEERVGKIISKVIQTDVAKEKAIDQEAHDLLKEHIKDIEAHSISYHKMFQRVKEKLARERGLIL